MRNAVTTEKEEVVSLMPDATSISSVRDRRWWILGVVGLAQLMVVLDATIVNIALPSAQRALGFSNADRQWVVTAYALAFGGLLLLGGRLSELVRRARVLCSRPGRLRRGLSAGRRGDQFRGAGNRPRRGFVVIFPLVFASSVFVPVSTFP